MNTEKVINIPVRRRVVDKENVLWLIAVNPQVKSDIYSCIPRSSWGGWDITVKSKTFEGAMKLVRECCEALGMEA